MVAVHGHSMQKSHDQTCLCDSLNEHLHLIDGIAQEEIIIVRIILGWVVPIEIPKPNCMGHAYMAMLKSKLAFSLVVG
jgi:hypothetical protein